MDKLVRDKDALIKRIDGCMTLSELQETLFALTLRFPVWLSEGYAYKGAELAKRVSTRMGELGLNTASDVGRWAQAVENMFFAAQVHYMRG